jgi:CheY-like chemotaxis protein
VRVHHIDAEDACHHGDFPQSIRIRGLTGSEMGDKTILIIDDDEVALKILEKVLTLTGYTVLQAQNGKAGISIARDRRPDLVLLDMKMPDLGGGEVRQILKDDPDTRCIPVGFVTGLMTKGESVTHEMGKDFFIAKPVNHAELLKKIKEHLA